MVDTGRRKDRPGDTRLARGLRRDHRPDAPAEHPVRSVGSIWSSKRASILTEATTPMITMTRTCHRDGRASTTRPATTENGLATKVPPKEARRTSTLHPATLTGCGPQHTNPDPIYGNVAPILMGKGYLLNIIALYEFVCGSTKYDEPI